MNFIWALLCNCKSSLFYWIFHWTFIIGGRKVLLKQTPQNMKVMNSSCFVTEQAKVHVKGDLGTTKAWVLLYWSLPQPALALSEPPCPTERSSQQLPPPCWECSLWHLPSGKTDPAFENRHPWKEVMIKFSACTILHKQNNVLWSSSCKMPLGMLFKPWCPIPHWCCSKELSSYCWSLPRVSAGLSQCCWMNSSVWSWEEMSHVVHFALETSSSVWGVNILGL